MSSVNVGAAPDSLSFDDAFFAALAVRDAFSHDAVIFVFQGVPVTVKSFTLASEAFEEYTSFTEPDGERPGVDADGHLPADAPLTCPYCACADSVEATLEYTAGYSEHRDLVGYECYSCLARWDSRGCAEKGPHATSVWVRSEYHRRGKEEA